MIATYQQRKYDIPEIVMATWLSRGYQAPDVVAWWAQMDALNEVERA